MTYRTETQTIEAFGIPYVEYRYEPEVEEKELVTIEFTPETHPLDDCGYPHPRFTFLEAVALQEQLDYCLENGLDLPEELDWFEIVAMELIAPRTSSGRLKEAPRWSYGLRRKTGTQELTWFEEEELIAKRDLSEEEEEF